MRRSRRSTASLDWELDLLGHLGASGFLVPEALPTRSGERHLDGFVVSPFIEGREPKDDPDWACVVAVLEQLHRVTVGWPQRPGARSTTDLLTTDTSDDVDLTLLPAEDRDACRAAWHRLEGWPTSVVHGDPGAPNVRMTRDGVALLDWDESRVDVSALDLADVPTRPLGEDRGPLAEAAADAWEAANGWTVEPSYARRRLGRLRRRPTST